MNGYDVQAEAQQKADDIVGWRRKVMACMETGNRDAATTAIRELADVSLSAAQRLRAEVAAAYGVGL
jgi:hypothetical protein